jgi:hypothetical protein
MDIATITQIVGGFQKFVGETLAELKRAEFATIDLDLLRLNRDKLRERLEDMEKDLAAAVKVEKSNKAAELAERGLSNSNVLPAFVMGIERDANDQLAIARREYNRAVEEIALMERRIVESRVPCWKRAVRYVRGR